MTSFQLLHLPPLPPFSRRPGGGQVCIFTARRHCVPGSSSETASRQPKLGLPLPVIGGRGISTTHSSPPDPAWTDPVSVLSSEFAWFPGWHWAQLGLARPGGGWDSVSGGPGHLCCTWNLLTVLSLPCTGWPHSEYGPEPGRMSYRGLLIKTMWEGERERERCIALQHS